MKNSAYLIIFVTIFIDLIGFGIVLPILPNYARDLNATPWMIGLIAAAFSLMQFFMAPIWGAFSDRVGRRPVILWGLLVTVVSYLIFSQADSIWLLLVSRLLAGVGSANVSTAQAYLTDISDAKDRSKAMGVIGAAFGLGFIFGPPLGGLIKATLGIAWVGYIAALLSGVSLVVAFAFLSESLKEKKTERPFAMVDISVLLAAFKKERTKFFLAINFFYIFAFVNLQVCLALLLKEHYELDDAGIGYAFAYIGLISALVQGRFIGIFTKYFSEQKVLFAGTVLMTLGIVLIPFTPQAALISIGLITLGTMAFGNALITPTNAALLTKTSSEGQHGSTLGVLQSVGALARILGPFSGSLLYAWNYHAPFLFGALMTLLASLCAWMILRLSVSEKS
ncbi:MAG: MFS transporter [Candidatus Caenarcaniphilales bacterium]|nr:MFS transporter [Candidatus Caenarcaniphilales bacterium]